MRRAASAATDLPKTANPKIRLLFVKHNAADFPQTDIEGTSWTASTRESARDFSAVAWYFAHEIEAREHVPIGVIDSTWGGTVAEAWTRLTALGEDPGLTPIFVARGHMTEREATALLEQTAHERERAGAKAQGKPEPQFPWHPILNMCDPSCFGTA